VSYERAMDPGRPRPCEQLELPFPYVNTDVSRKGLTPIEPSEGALDALDVVIDPIYHPVQCEMRLNDENLFVRPGRVIPVDGPLTQERLYALLDDVYKQGGNIEWGFITLEVAREKGLIGPLEYSWRRLLRWFRSLGTSKPSASSGARSAPPTRGTGRTATP